MNPNALTELNRRQFLKGSSFGSLMAMLGGVELTAQPAQKAEDEQKPKRPKVRCAVIGFGPWGREIVATLNVLDTAELVSVCEKYPAFLKRAESAAPKAKRVADYRAVLDDKDVQAVIIATPTHQHREIALAALQAGKHVYCEAPLAHTIEDARAIAKAAKDSPRQVFQPGHQNRSDPQRHFVLGFIRSGALGKTVVARAQWHKKQSWRHQSPNPEREVEINWRVRSQSSPGLIGEIGVHQIDNVSWILNSRPVAVTGWGSVMYWQDGRDVADTIQTVFEYPGGVQLIYDATLANSFDGDHEIYCGSDSAIMFRGNKAWLFKEVDSPLLGWEVYARKDTFYKETGIALAANASKSASQGESATDEPGYSDSPLHYALEAFLINSGEMSTGIEDFTGSFGSSDTQALIKYLSELTKQLAAGYKEGFDAAVTVLKANEAIRKGQKISFQKEWFDL